MGSLALDCSIVLATSLSGKMCAIWARLPAIGARLLLPQRLAPEVKAQHYRGRGQQMAGEELALTFRGVTGKRSVHERYTGLRGRARATDVGSRSSCMWFL